MFIELHPTGAGDDETKPGGDVFYSPVDDSHSPRMNGGGDDGHESDVDGWVDTDVDDAGAEEEHEQTQVIEFPSSTAAGGDRETPLLLTPPPSRRVCAPDQPEGDAKPDTRELVILAGTS